MSNFKAKVKSAYKVAQSRNIKAPERVPYYYKLAKTAMRIGQITGVLIFFIAFYGFDLGIFKSLLIAFLSFIFVQPVIGIAAAFLLKK